MNFIVILILLLGESLYASELKILSWNIFMLPKPIWFSMQSERTISIAKVLSTIDYDVIFFQEAFMKSFRTHAFENLKDKYPYEFYLDGSGFLYPVMGSGAYVLSKHPFRTLDKVQFSECSGADCFAAKGAMLIEVDLPLGKKIQFANTHLQAGSDNEEIRLKQMAQIKSMLDKHVKPDVPQVMVGDLNINFAKPEFQQGLSIMQMDYLKISGPIPYTNRLKNNCYKTPGDGKIHHWIDHAWLRGLSAKDSTMVVRPLYFRYKENECFLSDHHAMEVVLKFH